MEAWWSSHVRDYGYKVSIKRSVEEDLRGAGSVFLEHDQYGSTEITYDLAPHGADIRRLEDIAVSILQTKDPSSWKRDTLGG